MTGTTERRLHLRKRRTRRRLVDAAAEQLAADRLIGRDVVEEAVEELGRAGLRGGRQIRSLGDYREKLRPHGAELGGGGGDLRTVHAVSAELALPHAGEVKLVGRRRVGS